MARGMQSAREAEEAVVAVLTEYLTSQPENPVQQARFLPLARQIVDRLAALPDEGQMENLRFAVRTMAAEQLRGSSPTPDTWHDEEGNEWCVQGPPPAQPEGNAQDPEALTEEEIRAVLKWANSPGTVTATLTELGASQRGRAKLRALLPDSQEDGK